MNQTPETPQEPLHVLLLDDNPDDRALALRELRRAFPTLRVTEVLDAAGLDQALEADGFDLTVTDYQIRWTDGLTVLRQVKSRYPDKPVIMFTNTGNEEVAVEAMKAGLDDYVNKSPKHFFRLGLAVRAALDRAAARRRAAQLELRLQDLLDHLNVGVFRASPDGRLLEGNAAFLRLLGLTSLAEGQALLDRFPDARAQALEALGGGPGFERELRLPRPEGGQGILALSAAVRTIGGQLFIDGLLEDVTERRRAQAENERLLRQVQEGAARERGFLRDVLSSVTEGRLHLCDAPSDLPSRAAPFGEPVPLTRQDIRTIRRLVQAAAAAQGFPEERCDELVTAVGEAAMNAVVHAGGGQGRVCVGDGLLQVWVEDRGRGIAVERLPRATLERGYTTAGTLGHGFWIMLNTIDRVSLLTGPGGTTLVLEQQRLAPLPTWQAARAADPP